MATNCISCGKTIPPDLTTCPNCDDLTLGEEFEDGLDSTAEVLVLDGDDEVLLLGDENEETSLDEIVTPMPVSRSRPPRPSASRRQVIPGDPSKQPRAIDRDEPAEEASGSSLWQERLDQGHQKLKAKNYDDAIIAFAQALVEAPEEHVGQCYRSRGYAYLNKSDFDLAIEDCQAAINRNSGDAEAYAWRGAAYAGKQQWRETIDDYIEAIRLSPLTEVEYRKFANAFVETALVAFSAQLAEDSNNGGLHQDRGVALAFKGRHREAIADYTQAIRLQPKDAISYVKRAESFRELGEFEKVVADTSMAIKLHDRRAIVYHLRGTAYCCTRHYEKSISDLSKAITVDQNYPVFFYDRGCVYKLMNRFTEAIKDFSSAIRLAPDDPVYYLHRGNSYAASDKLAEAVSDFDRAIERVPDDTTVHSARGEALAGLGQYEQAITDFDEAVRINPMDATAYCQRGRCYRALNNFEKALAELTKTIRLDQRNELAYDLRGDVHVALEMYDEAADDYSQRLRLHPDGPVTADERNIYFRRGLAWLRAGQHEAAMEDLDRAIQEDECDVDAFDCRAAVRAAVEQWGPAITDLERATELRPDRSAKYNRKLQRYVKKALPEFERQIVEDPENASLYCSRGIAFMHKGEPEKAIADFTESLRRQPDEADVYLKRAAALMAASRFKEVIADATKAMALGRKFASTYYLRGEAHRQLAAFAKAIKDIGAAIHLEPNNPGYQFNRGRAYAACGKSKEAVSDFEAAIALAPDGHTYHLHLGNVLATMGETRRAIKRFGEAIRLDPHDPIKYNSRGYTYARAKEFEKAIADFDKAIELDGSLVSAYRNRALTIAKMGDTDRAILELTKTIRLDPKLYALRGDMYFNLGEYENAADDYAEVIRADRKSKAVGSYYRRRGIALLKHNDVPRAIVSFKNALRLDPNDAESRRGLRIANRTETDQKGTTEQPGASQRRGKAEWLIKAADESEFGPISKMDLDEWVAEGRVDAECQLLRESWDAWRWAEEVYPELTVIAHRMSHRPIPLEESADDDQWVDTGEAVADQTLDEPAEEENAGPGVQINTGRPRRRRR